MVLRQAVSHLVCPIQDAPTISEYLDIFAGPVNVDLDVESVWPMPAPLKF